MMRPVISADRPRDPGSFPVPLYLKMVIGLSISLMLTVVMLFAQLAVTGRFTSFFRYYSHRSLLPSSPFPSSIHRTMLSIDNDTTPSPVNISSNSVSDLINPNSGSFSSAHISGSLSAASLSVSSVSASFMNVSSLTSTSLYINSTLLSPSLITGSLNHSAAGSAAFSASLYASGNFIEVSEEISVTSLIATGNVSSSSIFSTSLVNTNSSGGGGSLTASAFSLSGVLSAANTSVSGSLFVPNGHISVSGVLITSNVTVAALSVTSSLTIGADLRLSSSPSGENMTSLSISQSFISSALNVSGNITVSAALSANSLSSAGVKLISGNVQANTLSTSSTGGGLTATAVSVGVLTATTRIINTGSVSVSNMSSSDNITTVTLSANSLSANSLSSAGEITVSGVVRASSLSVISGISTTNGSSSVQIAEEVIAHSVQNTGSQLSVARNISSSTLTAGSIWFTSSAAEVQTAGALTADTSIHTVTLSVATLTGSYLTSSSGITTGSISSLGNAITASSIIVYGDMTVSSLSITSALTAGTGLGPSDAPSTITGTLSANALSVDGPLHSNTLSTSGVLTAASGFLSSGDLTVGTLTAQSVSTASLVMMGALSVAGPIQFTMSSISTLGKVTANSINSAGLTCSALSSGAGVVTAGSVTTGTLTATNAVVTGGVGASLNGLSTGALTSTSGVFSSTLTVSSWLTAAVGCTISNSMDCDSLRISGVYTQSARRQERLSRAGGSMSRGVTYVAPSTTTVEVSGGYTIHGCGHDGRYTYCIDGNNQKNVHRFDTREGLQIVSAGVTSVDLNLLSSPLSLSFSFGNDIVFDGKYLYFVPANMGNPYFVRYDTTKTFTSASSWLFVATTVLGLNAGIYTGTEVLLVPQTAVGKFVRFVPTDAGSELANPTSYLYTVASTMFWTYAVFDGRYMYALPQIGHNWLVRYNTVPGTDAAFQTLSNWQSIDLTAAPLSMTARGWGSGVFDGRYMYIGRNKADTANPAFLLRLDTLDDWTQPRAWTIYEYPSTHKDVGGGMVYDGRFLYLIPSQPQSGPSDVVIYDTMRQFISASSYSSVPTVNSGDNRYTSNVYDGRYIYMFGQSKIQVLDTGAPDRFPSLRNMAVGSDLYISSSGVVGIGTNIPEQLVPTNLPLKKLHVVGSVHVEGDLNADTSISGNIRLTGPASPTISAPCLQGTITYDSSALYLCYATDSWSRFPLSGY